MIQKIKTFIVSMSALLTLGGGVAIVATAPALAATTNSIQNNLCQGANLNLANGSSNCAGGTSSFQKILKAILNILSIIVGAVAVIMLIIGGFRYVTSGGSEAAVKGAKNTIIYALVGLVIVALAQIVVQFVLNKTTGV